MTVPEDLAVELLGLADRYLLNDLKLLCGFTLARMISVETVCRIVQAADRWDARDSQLRAQCIECAMRRASDRGRPTANHTRHRLTHPATHTPPLTPRSSRFLHLCRFIVENYKEVVSSATYDELTTSPQILLDIAKAVAPSVKKGKNPSPAASSYTPPSKRPKLGSR